MFHIITCLANDSNRLIENVLKEFLEAVEDIDATLECFKSPGRMLKQLADIHDGENYLILVGDFVDSSHTLELLSTIREKLRYCYILFISQNARLLYPAINQNTRISGFVTSPLVDNTLLNLVRQTYKDYRADNIEDSSKILTIYTLRGDEHGKERIMIRIPFEDIYFIEACNRKIRYVLQSTVYSDNGTLTERELVLDNRFIRCHHAFIINAEKIKYINYGKNELGLKNGDVIPISRAKKKNLKQILLDLHMNIATIDCEQEEDVACTADVK